MNLKKALVLLSVLVIGAIPASASEAVWDVLVATGLKPSALVLPGPLPGPEPGPREVLAEEAFPAPAPQVWVPKSLPVTRRPAGSGKALFDANLVLLVGLNVADYVSTREALKYPGLTETNPLMAPFVKSPAAFAAVKLGTTALSYWSMKAVFKRNRTLAWVMTTASNALLSFVVANNLRLIRGARAR